MNELIQRLATNEIFEVLTDGERTQVATLFENTQLPAGSFIYHGGEHRHRLFFVQQGRIEVLGGEGPGDKVMLVYREGNYFGEACLLDESAHSTSARPLAEDLRRVEQAVLGVRAACRDARTEEDTLGDVRLVQFHEQTGELVRLERGASEIASRAEGTVITIPLARGREQGLQ